MTDKPTFGAPQGDHASLKILVVEDNIDSQRLVCELLDALGHHATGVGSGELALTELQAHPFDTLFTDVNLPGMSGVELARIVSRTQPSLSIIFASGYGAQLGKNLGADAIVLPKPYDIDELQDILARIIRMRSTH